MEYLICAFCAVILLALAYTLLNRKTKQNTIPGPDCTDKIEGNNSDIKASGSIHQFLTNIHQKYGDIVAFHLGEQFCVSIASPELFKEQAKVFDRPWQFFALFEPLFTSHSITYTNGEEGRRRHAAYARSFTHACMQDYMESFCTLSKEQCTQLEGVAQEEHIPLSKYTMSFAATTIMRVAFGQDHKEAVEFKKCYDLVWWEMESRLAGHSPDDAREKRFQNYKQRMNELLLTSYKEAKNNALPVTGQMRFIDELLDLDLAEEVVMADMMTMCVAGFHTTGLLLTWSLYYLALHDDIQEKVYEEMKELLGDETITFPAVNQLSYTRQVLDETLRCSILAPYAARVSDCDIQLGGYQVPKGTPVLQALGVVSQDERLWTDPEKFDPSRFSEEKAKHFKPFTFEPFGYAGKRKCPGCRFSYFEATTLLSEIIRRFKVRLVDGQVIKKEYGLVCKPSEEIWITLQSRSA